MNYRPNISPNVATGRLLSAAKGRALAMFRTRKDMSDNLPDEHTSLGIGS